MLSYAEESKRTRWLEITWMILVTAALSLHLGDWALLDPDEGRNAAIALEMMTSGDFLIPRLNKVPYLDKPALFFAAEGIAMKLFGGSELTARLPSLLSALATVALTAWFSAYLFGRETAWIAGTVCATAPLTMIMARVAIFDSMLSFFIVLALVAFYRSLESEPVSSGFRWPLWTMLAWASMGLGVMTKGPVALLIPLLVAVPFAVWRRRNPAIWHVAGWATFLVIIIPWILAVESRMPGFLRYSLVTETWERVTTDKLHRDAPIWYFLPYLLAGCFPWIVVAVVSRWRTAETSLKEKGHLIYVGMWVLLPLVFFSLSNSKRPQYILPLIPAIALLVAWTWSRERPPVRGARAAALSLFVFGTTLVLLVTSDRWSGIAGEFAAASRMPLLVLGILTMISGILSWLSSRHRRVALVALSMPLIMFVTVTSPLLRAIADSRSSAALAASLRPFLRSETVLVGVDTFVPSLTFYAGRPIRLSTSTGDPLRSNYVLHDYDTLARSSSTLRPGGWWKAAAQSCSEPLIFLLKPKDQKGRSVLRAEGLPLLYEDRKIVAMGPCQQKQPVSEPQAGSSSK